MRNIGATGDAGLVGRRIVQTAWASDAIFAATSVPFAMGVGSLERVSVAVDLTLFLVSLPVWIYAFLSAVGRTSRGDDIAVASLFFLHGSAPAVIRLHLLGALGVCLAITAGTAKANPFGVLVPMLSLGLVGLWGARHGTYPARQAQTGSERRSHGRSGA